MDTNKQSDVKTTNTSTITDRVVDGATRIHAEQDDLSGEGVSFKPGSAGKIDATEKASQEIGAKKAANPE
jgi:hypothetical protein